jgi:hypothetical protein
LDPSGGVDAGPSPGLYFSHGKKPGSVWRKERLFINRL